MEGFIPIFFLILNNPKTHCGTIKYLQQLQKRVSQQKMSKLLDIYELFDVSSSSEDEEEMQERESTPLPRESISNNRVVLNTSFLSPTEAVADEEDYFDISADSLEADCKRMRLNSTLESLETGELAIKSTKSIDSTMKESPESPDEDDSRSNSGVFVVEGHCAPSPKSMTSVVIADYLEEVAREDASSYFVTPPGPLRRTVHQTMSPLNDLDAKKTISVERATIMSTPSTCRSISINPGKLYVP